MNDLSGELGDSERDLVFVPKDSVYVGLHCHGDSRRMGGSGFKGISIVAIHTLLPPKGFFTPPATEKILCTEVKVLQNRDMEQ